MKVCLNNALDLIIQLSATEVSVIVAFHDLDVGGRGDMVDKLLLCFHVSELVFLAENESDRYLIDLTNLDQVSLMASKHTPARRELLEPA